MDPRVIVYPTRLQQFYQELCDPDRRVFNEMFEFYEDIEIWCPTWDGGYQPQFFDFELARTQSEDYSLHFHVAFWISLAERADLAWHMLSLEDGPEILDPEQEDQREETENMYALGCTPLAHARLTAEQAGELRRESGRAGPLARASMVKHRD